MTKPDDEILISHPHELFIDANRIAEILVRYGAPPLVAAKAANAVLEYVVDCARQAGGQEKGRLN
jgi:hypothetical protein